MEQLRLFEDAGQLKLPVHLLEYIPHFFERGESTFFLNKFIETVHWKQRRVPMYNKEVLTPRLTAWFGDVTEDNEPYGEGKSPWTKELLLIKSKVEAYTGIIFNGVLLNYYRDGNDSVAWHSDKDTVPGMKTEIASVSFGQPRMFDFRSKENSKQKYSLELGHGALLLMKGDLQKYWEHRIAKSNAPMEPRINLTFRIIRK